MLSPRSRLGLLSLAGIPFSHLTIWTPGYYRLSVAPEPQWIAEGADAEHDWSAPIGPMRWSLDLLGAPRHIDAEVAPKFRISD